MHQLLKGIGLRSWGQNPYSHIKTWQMSDAICVIYVKNAKNAIFDAYTIWPISHLYMAIWVSKDASGSQKCRPIPLSNSFTDLHARNIKILFEIFLCIFPDFLCIIDLVCAMPLKGFMKSFFSKKCLNMAK